MLSRATNVLKASMRTVTVFLMIAFLLLAATPLLPVQKAEASPLWVKRTAGVSNSAFINGTRYSGGRWFYFAENNIIGISDDAITWTETSVTPYGTDNPAWYDVCYLNGTWHLAGLTSHFFSGTADPTNPKNILWEDTWVPSMYFYFFTRIATDGTNLVAVGEQSHVVFSSNGGLTWTESQAGTLASGQSYLWDVIYENGKYVAVGPIDFYDPAAGGKLLWSVDGTKWTEIIEPFRAGALWSVAYHNNTYVVTGENGRIWTSSDLSTWVERTSGTSNPLYGVVYGADRFIAVGYAGTIVSSPDGITWEPEASPTAQDLFHVECDDNQFVAVGASGTVLTRSFYANDATLSGLSVSGGTLSPAFTTGTTSYSTKVANSVSSVGVTATANDAGATLTINGAAAGSGVAKTVALAAGTNTIDIVVTAGDGVTTKTYTVTVGRLSGNADLSGLAISPGMLAPTFAAGTTEYSASVPYSAGTISVTPTVADAAATVTVNGIGTASGSHVDVSLSVGPNTIPVAVTAEDGTKKTYSLTVTRQPASTNSSLAGLAVDGLELSPEFAAATHDYTVKVPVSATSVTVTATAADSNASLAINGAAVVSGASRAVPLTAGTNVVTVLVTAEDGATTTSYTLTVERLSNDANLSGLTFSLGTLTTDFVSGTTAYDLSVPHGNASLQVTATVSFASATLTVNGDAVESGSAATVAVSDTDPTVVEIAVTAEDEVTTRTYAVTIWPAPAFSGAASNSYQLVSAGGTLAALQTEHVTGQTLNFAVTGVLPENLSLGAATGAFSGTAAAGWADTSSDVTITVSDLYGGKAEQVLTIDVQAAPTFTGDPVNTAQLVSVGGTPSALQATAAAGETLTFTLTGGSLPTGVSLNADGTFGGAASTVGAYTATIQAADAHGGSTSTSLIITVQAGPAFTADPQNTNQLVSVGGGLSSLQASAAAGESLTYTLDGGTLPAGITLNADGSFAGTATTVETTSATIEITDTHGGHATTTLGVTVQAAPAFTVSTINTAQLVSVGGSMSALETTKAAGETLTFSRTGGSLPDGITLNANGSFSGTVTTTGVTTVAIQVTDTHGGQAVTSLEVTVQAAPAFTGDPVNTAQLVSVGGSPSALQATAAAGETLTFTLTGGSLPAGVSLNTDGTFGGAATTVGAYTATIQAADAHGGSTSTSLIITVQAGPAFTADPQNTNQLVSVGGGLSSLQASAAAGESLTYTLDGGTLPAGITLNADGSFAGTATTVETTSATIEITDTHGGHATATLAVTVQAAPAFTASTVNTAQLVSVGGSMSALETTKAAGETLTFSRTGGSLPDGITLNANGSFSGTVTTTGVTTAAIRVIDTHGGQAVTSLEVTVQVAPVFTGDPVNTAQLVSVGGTPSALQATAAAGETLTFTLTGGSLPAGVSLNADGTFGGAATTVGAYTATIQAADAHGGSTSTSLSITVQAGPAFTADPQNTAQTTSTGAGLMTLTTTAAPGETVSFELADGTLPPGITLNGDGSFSGTASTAGTGEATITVADTHGGSASTTLAITVLQGPVFTADGTNTAQSIWRRQRLAALLATADAGQTLTFSLVSGSLPPDITLNTDGSFTGTATPTGTFNAVIAVVDGRGGRATTNLTITVSAPPPVSKDTTAPVITLNGATEITLELGAIFTDPGATAIDDRDGNIASRVVASGAVDVTRPGRYTILYSVSDAAGNKASATRTVHVVDTTSPLIALNGQAAVTIKVGDTYAEVGATASDNYDGDISGHIHVYGSVDTSKAGVYTLTYSVSDTSGNTSTVNRAVTVTLPEAGEEPLTLTTLINGKSYAIGEDARPFDSVTAFYGKQGVTVMALRLFEELGATFTYVWQPGGGVITMFYDHMVVTLTEGSDVMRVTDDSGTRLVHLRTAVVNRGGRAFIPTRDVSEYLGFDVEWNAADDSITITFR